MPDSPSGEGNNIPPGCSLSAFLSRNSSVYSHLACPPHISCYPSPGSGCLSFLPASHSPLCLISSIRWSSCAPARMHEYSVTATNTPAAAMIPFILLHPFPYGELPYINFCVDIFPFKTCNGQFPIYKHKKTLTDSFCKRPYVLLNYYCVAMSVFLDCSKRCQSSFLFLQNIITELAIPQTAIPAKASHNQNGLSSPVFGVSADGVFGFGVSFG